MMRTIKSPAITVADLLWHGVDEIAAYCQCGENWLAPITILPLATTLAKIAELMVCPTCGGSDIRVAPAWPGDVPKIN